MLDRDEALAEAIPRAALALAITSALYAMGDFMVPGNFELEVPYYFLATWIPTATLLCHRYGLVTPRTNVLVADLLWTLLVGFGLGFAPQVTISGTAFILSLKWLASALLLPWPVYMQLASVAVGLTLYFGTMMTAPQLGIVYVHQWLLPPIAAVLSIVGARILAKSREQAEQLRRLLQYSEQQLHTLINLSPDGVFVVQDDRIAFANDRVAIFLGYDAPQALISKSLADLTVPSEHARLEAFAREASTTTRPLPARSLQLLHHDGTPVPATLTCAPVSYRGSTASQVTLRDLTITRGDLTLLEGERHVLEAIASGSSLSNQLDSICRLIEELDPSIRTSVLLANAEGSHLYHGAAPSLSPAYVAAIDGVEIREGNGTCGTAAARREPIVTADIAHDPNWSDYRLLAREHGLAACWSTPILSASGELLGTFATYSRLPTNPAQETARLVQHATHLASIAIQRHRLEQRQLDEAEISSTLATLGRALISSLDRRVLLQQLCDATRSALHTDVSHVYLLDRDEDMLEAVASRGDTPEQWEAIQALRLTPSHIPVFLEKLQALGSLEVSETTNTDLLPTALQAAYGIRSGIFAPLRSGTALVGAIAAGYRHTNAAFSAHQHRLARGIAQLASLALDNSRLLEELDGANRIKSNFVATMSHELRTPLNVLIGYQDLLLDDEFGPLTSDQQEIVRRLSFHARQLLVLVNDTLDLSRLESGRMTITAETIDLGGFIENLRKETEEAWGHRGLTLGFDVEGGSTLHSDPVKLHVILRSLIANAVKFTEHGSVRVAVRRQGNGIEIVVSDTGIGIPEEARDIIFEPFQQAAPTISNRFGGAGLGLHIVKRLLDVLGGTIAVASTVGSGSTFTLLVPDLPSDTDIATPSPA